MTQYILSLDQGTTSSRALLVSGSGAVTHISQKSFPQYFPKSGFVEHNAEEIWDSMQSAIQEVLQKAKISLQEVKAIGITNQRETTVIWDRKTGKPIFHALVWQDRRTADLCSKLKASEEMLRQKTGLLLDPYFSATKIAYLLKTIPGAKEKAKLGQLAFGTIDSWLVWNLTKGKLHITDATNASRTLLYNIHTHTWDEEILDLFDIPKQILPEVRGCSEIYGNAFDKVPIAGMAGDQQAALFGQCCFFPKMAKATYGTGCFMLLNTGEQKIFSSHHLLTTIAMQIGKQTQYALEGSVFIAGALLDWLKNSVHLLSDIEEIDKVVASVPDSGGVYFVPAFTGLGAPHWDPHARGAILGLSRGTKSEHIVRAALESIAYQAFDVFSAIEQDAGFPIQEIRVDGGVSKSVSLMQFQADLLQRKITKTASQEATALGAAYLAGLGVGFWKDKEELQTFWRAEKTFTPQKKIPSDLWEKAVGRTKNWI